MGFEYEKYLYMIKSIVLPGSNNIVVIKNNMSDNR